ncbi:hypothetical protein [Alloalcanivorax gelatiniphagus]|uniref:MaoC family dehydratase n=1 Tax=Alloalcanivorax gelatiniphagus TaxID=1194167 RepID=A0ABY2XMT7_9GAMM|nr:hypothetical protein [Alloalcanivorax gelatiniphagus]TMW13154.1 hypothetical protein FGS76_08820 [Alloalcanivorax gelatiniphagus]|tara:strand:+ start:6944 stop:7318 length:375 start_codon:yes stop_codon:yes gene_type:complete
MSQPRFDALKIDDQARVTRRYSDEDIQEWCRLAEFDGDWGTVPEPLIAALFSYLLGEQLPGHGTNYLKQSMRFHDQGRPGEALTASVAVSRLRGDKALVNLHTRCVGEDGRLLCDGEALVLFQC